MHIFLQNLRFFVTKKLTFLKIVVFWWIVFFCWLHLFLFRIETFLSFHWNMFWSLGTNAYLFGIKRANLWIQVLLAVEHGWWSKSTLIIIITCGYEMIQCGLLVSYACQLLIDNWNSILYIEVFFYISLINICSW